MPHPGRGSTGHRPPGSGARPGYRRGPPTVFDGGVPWVFARLRRGVRRCSPWPTVAPVRREPFTVLCFVGAFVVGELPGPHRRGGAGRHGRLRRRRWPPTAGLVDGLASAWPPPVAYVGLAVVARRSGRLVTAVARRGHRRTARGRRASTCARRGSTWWRLVLAVPFRFRRIRRIRNIDYVGRRALPPQARRPGPPGRPARRPGRCSSTSTAGPGSSATSGSRASR